MPLGQREASRLVAVDLIASGQVEYVRVPLVIYVAHATHRHQMMFVGKFPLDRVLLGHTQLERFSQRVQVMHLYP